MKLSELVYLSVKNAIYYDDFSFTREEFLNRTFDNSPDYATNINNVFTPINEAIARLSDLERIPYQVEECEVSNRIINLNNLTNEKNEKNEERKKIVKEVINVAEVNSYGAYQKLSHRPFGIGKVIVLDYFNSFNKIYIEYKEDIPAFNIDHIPFKDFRDNLVDSNDYELREFGITDSMCNYIIEYASGRLLEQVSADLSNMHITRAEQYFANIKPVTQAFAQQTVSRVYGVGE